MGRDTQSTVYTAELQGISLALQILETSPVGQPSKATIFTDNQSALINMRMPGNILGQYILWNALFLLRKITTLGIEVDFRWILAHRRVPGNEAADQAVKQAAEEGTRPARAAPQENHNGNRDQYQDRYRGIGTLLTTAKRIINNALQDDRDTIWKHGKHGRILHSLDIGPDKKALKMHLNPPRAISSIIT